jgi:hypothetical protein
MVRAGAVVEKIGVMRLISVRGLGRSWACLRMSQELWFRDVIRKLFGERQVVVANLNPRELLVIAREVTI